MSSFKAGAPGACDDRGRESYRGRSAPGSPRRRSVSGGVSAGASGPWLKGGSRAPVRGREVEDLSAMPPGSPPHSLGPLPNRRASPLESYCGGPRFLRDPCPPIPRRHADDRPSATMPNQSSPGLSMRNVVHLRPARTGAGAGVTWSPSPVLRPDTRHGRRT